MRSKVAERILKRTSPEIKERVSLYADHLVRIGQLLKEEHAERNGSAVTANSELSGISKPSNGVDESEIIFGYPEVFGR